MCRFKALALPITDRSSPCHVASMIEHRPQPYLKTAPDRLDLNVLLRETWCKAIVFSLACLLAWGGPTFRAQSQGTTPAIFSASEVEKSFTEQAPRYRQLFLANPADLLAKNYFAMTLSMRTIPQQVKAGVNAINFFKDHTPQRITKDNVDAYMKVYSGTLAILDQTIRQRGFRQVGGTFVMNIGPSCEGFNDGTVSITQSDFSVKLVSGWPAVFDRLAQQGGSVHFEGVVIEDTIAVGALGIMAEVIGLGKVEAGRTEINFGKCKVMLAIGPLAAAPSSAAHGDLIDASEAGDLSRVKALLAAKADVNAKAPDGATALLTASAYGHLDVVQVLLAGKPDLNAKRAEDGGTALFIASQEGYLGVVQALLAAKADVTPRGWMAPRR
jgi:hypothetical protein